MSTHSAARPPRLQLAPQQPFAPGYHETKGHVQLAWMMKRNWSSSWEVAKP